MIEGSGNQDNLLDTTDCLEAVSVFRGWKNFLFVITFFSLLLLQSVFWMAVIKSSNQQKDALLAAEAKEKQVEPAVTLDPVNLQLPNDVNLISEAVKKVMADPNEQVAGTQSSVKGVLRFVKFEHLEWTVRFVNFILVLSATLYCLSLLFSVKISLLGRLGGINHISRAFFISLTFLVLLLPWQELFGPVVKGAIFTAEELTCRCQSDKGSIFGAMLFYLRFTGYWVVVLLTLLFAQLRSGRWTRATLRRLEII
jgi:hypothetical protein